MDYINYVKQSPVQGLTGLYGGVQGSLMAAAAGGGGEEGSDIDYGGGRGLYTAGGISYFSYMTDADAANFGGTYIIVALADVLSFASCTVLKTGKFKCVWPPLFGVTPPTSFV